MNKRDRKKETAAGLLLYNQGSNNPASNNSASNNSASNNPVSCSPVSYTWHHPYSHGTIKYDTSMTYLFDTVETGLL